VDSATEFQWILACSYRMRRTASISLRRSFFDFSNRGRFPDRISLRGFPAPVWIVAIYRFCEFVRLRAEIVLQYVAVRIDKECHHPS